MKGLLTFCTLFALYCAAHSEVVQLDNSNFDQVITTRAVTWFSMHSSFM